MKRTLKAAAGTVVAALALSGCATGSGPLGGTGERLAKFARADVERAREIAAAAKDSAGGACADAILKHLPDGGAAALAPSGAFSVFMQAREARRKVGAGVDEEVHNTCAPLVLDAQQTLLKLGLMAVPGGGAVRGLLGR
jgi:hypothetical protein